MSEKLKFLVGFFYFSGWKELYEKLQEDESIELKLLVGLQVSQILSSAFEHAFEEDDQSRDDQFQDFITSLGNAINNEEMDNEEFYNQVEFFIRMIEEGRLQIRKTENPNHAKLYIFVFDEEHRLDFGQPSLFVTGSSNLTKAGLSGQEEFNVEIKDYGWSEAEKYFDDLWDLAIPITEIEERRDYLIKFIQHKSQAATVTPFEAYALILKTYIDLQQKKKIRPEVEHLIEEVGYMKFSYQLDAVNQALSIIEEYNGAIIADVVGLGKSVIAALIAKNLGRRGMVICSPGLIGDKDTSTGWWEYIHNFKLYDWEVESKGRIVEIANTIHDKEIDVVIVDEAHYYRNQDTADYEALLSICRDRTVILLTATPFNNSPADIFSLLKLFIIPGKSGITLEDNLEGLFRAYNYRFKKLSEITKNYDSPDPKKRKKAESLYTKIIGEQPPVDIAKVEQETQHLANQIKNVISSVVIRRNRLDLKEDFQYSEEIKELSTVKDPQELFYKLTKEQSDFYDRIISEYFAEEGVFNGAIYQPFSYESPVDKKGKLDEEGNRAFQQQRNLYDFMRRLLVKRFESSFGAFSKSIDRFIHVHEVVQDFIDQSGGKYILDRDFIESIYKYDEEEIIEQLHKFANDLLDKKTPKNNTVYEIDQFYKKDQFLADIENDKQLFIEIKNELKRLNLVASDPKRVNVYIEIESILSKEPERKVIIFTEYVDTVHHLEKYFREKMGSKVLICDGKMTKELRRMLNSDFNAQYKGGRSNQFKVLITSDKLSEGFNLNRAGAIINYDIPWNPTRVIQRVGRINRIGTKVFDELFIFNFFPSEAGADIVKSREIASQKMFLIHNTLGEDAKIFAAEEEPTASGLYNKINVSPEDEDEVNTTTLIRNRYNEIEQAHPEVIEKISELPPRVKTAKAFSNDQLAVLRKKGLSLFAQVINDTSNSPEQVGDITFEELLPLVQCNLSENRLPLSNKFWYSYNYVKSYKPTRRTGRSDIALERKAEENLRVGLKIISAKESNLAEFMKTMIKDVRKYHTLSKRTLGRLGRKELSRNSSEEERLAFFNEVRWILNQLGHDYLDRILVRVKGQRQEVIIAVENVG